MLMAEIEPLARFAIDYYITAATSCEAGEPLCLSALRKGMLPPI